MLYPILSTILDGSLVKFKGLLIIFEFQMQSLKTQQQRDPRLPDSWICLFPKSQGQRALGTKRYLPVVNTDLERNPILLLQYRGGFEWVDLSFFRFI